MSKHEILRDQWVAYFETFTSDHADQLVSLGVDGRQPKHEVVDIEARELPLREIAVDLKDKESTLVISLGLSKDKLLRHSIQSVTNVRVVETENGSVVALEIVSINGQTTTLNLSVPVLPKAM